MLKVGNASACSGCRLCQLACSERNCGAFNPKKALLRVAELPGQAGFQVFTCNECGRCAEACPAGAITGGEAGYLVDREACTGCGSCAAACPQGVIVLAEQASKCVRCYACVPICPHAVLEVV